MLRYFGLFFKAVTKIYKVFRELPDLKSIIFIEGVAIWGIKVNYISSIPTSVAGCL